MPLTDIHPLLTLSTIWKTVAALVVSVMLFDFLRPRKKPDYRGRHVVVTGGSQGMGKSIAAAFVRRGAHVTILARTQKTLDAAQTELEALASSQRHTARGAGGETVIKQRVKAISCDCSDADSVKKAFEDAGPPDVLFCCAGTAHPGLFLEMTSDELVKPMRNNYDSAVICAQTALKAMLRSPLSSSDAKTFKRKIVFTSTVAAFMGLTGYDSYTPTKAAIRALADTLRQECQWYDVSVHCVFPATIYSPSHAWEQSVKPQILKDLEEGDKGQTPDEVAAAAMKGLDKGYHHIPTEFQGDLLRCNMKGPSPPNSPLDLVYRVVAALAMPFVMYDHDTKVRKYGEKHKIREKHAALS